MGRVGIETSMLLRRRCARSFLLLTRGREVGVQVDSQSFQLV